MPTFTPASVSYYGRTFSTATRSEVARAMGLHDELRNIVFSGRDPIGIVNQPVVRSRKYPLRFRRLPYGEWIVSHSLPERLAIPLGIPRGRVFIDREQLALVIGPLGITPPTPGMVRLQATLTIQTSRTYSRSRSAIKERARKLIATHFPAGRPQ